MILLFSVSRRRNFEIDISACPGSAVSTFEIPPRRIRKRRRKFCMYNERYEICTYSSVKGMKDRENRSFTSPGSFAEAIQHRGFRNESWERGKAFDRSSLFFIRHFPIFPCLFLSPFPHFSAFPSNPFSPFSFSVSPFRVYFTFFSSLF